MDYAYLAKFFTVIISVAISDVCWTFYFITIENKKAIASGLWSAVIMCLGAFSVSSRQIIYYRCSHRSIHRNFRKRIL